MIKFLEVGIFVAIFGLAVTAPSYHHDNHHDASAYAVVTKHDSYPQHGWVPYHYHHDDHHDEDHHSHKAVADNHNDHEDVHEHDYHDAHAKYEFDYGVKDSKTGDIKNQWEHRDGDHVKGSYSLKEADGTTRVVEYSADDHKGFNAVVKKIGHADHPVVYAKPVHHVGHSDHKAHDGHDDYHYDHTHGSHGGPDSYHYDHTHGSHGDHATSYIKV